MVICIILFLIQIWFKNLLFILIIETEQSTDSLCWHILYCSTFINNFKRLTLICPCTRSPVSVFFCPNFDPHHLCLSHFAQERRSLTSTVGAMLHCTHLPLSTTQSSLTPSSSCSSSMRSMLARSMERGMCLMASLATLSSAASCWAPLACRSHTYYL